VEHLRRFLHRRIARGLVARAGALVMAVVLLASVLGAGRRYFFCPIMNAAMSTSCCAGAAHAEDPSDDGDATDALTMPECCQVRRIAAIASAPVPGADQEELVSPVVATLSAVDERSVALAVPAATRFTHHVRAGPRPPGARRAELMIWTC